MRNASGCAFSGCIEMWNVPELAIDQQDLLRVKPSGLIWLDEKWSVPLEHSGMRKGDRVDGEVVLHY